MRLCLILSASICAFAQSPVDNAWKILDQAMQDGNPAKRIEAVIALGVVRPQARPLRTAEEALKDKDSGVRQAACSTLGEMRSRAALPALREALNDDAPEVVFAAAKALYAMNDPAGRTVLIGVLEGDRAGSSGFVSSSMREMKLKMHDPKALLLIGINQSAGLLGPFGMGIPIAERLMKDSQASGKTIAALLLATDRTEESKQALRTALEDKNWTVRVAAARAVALRDLSDLYKDVAPLLDDKRDEVRYAAAATLIRLRQAQNKTPRRKPGRS